MKTILLLILNGFLVNATFLPIAAAAEKIDGQALHDTHCISCHAAQYAEDPDQMYTRKDRTVKDYSTLKNRVSLCVNNQGIAWFDEEIAAVVDYLNSEFYHYEVEKAK